MLERLKIGLDMLAKPGTEPEIRSGPPRPVWTSGQDTGNRRGYAISLQRVLDELGSLPPASVVLGACEDGFHIYMDLTDPRPGAILITGDPGCGKARLLGAILASVVMLSSPRQVRYSLVTVDPGGYDGLAHQAHCYKVMSPDNREVGQLIMELVGIVEGRLTVRQSGPAILLAIDDLVSLYESLDDPEIEALLWLIQSGPQVQVWPIATLHAGEIEFIDDVLVQGFATRLIGKIDSPQLAELLSDDPNPVATNLVAGAQFSLMFEDDWLNLWIPEVGGMVP